MINNMPKLAFQLIIIGLILALNISIYNENSYHAIEIQNTNTKLSTGSFSELSYYPTYHFFDNKYEGIVDNTTFEIWNSGCCGLTYYFIEECTWLSIFPESGASYGEKDKITITINTTGLDFGIYNYDILIDTSKDDAYFHVKLNVIRPPNNVPEDPSIIGPTSGKYGEEYEFIAKTTDPDDDQIWYMWDWGDGNFSNWLGPYNTGENCTTYHIWSEEGNFTIKVKAKDEYDEESNWSKPLKISLPKNRTFTFNFYKFFKWLSMFFLQLKII